MPNDHEELICWQRSDELRQLIIQHTEPGTRAATDLRFTTNLRDAIGSAAEDDADAPRLVFGSLLPVPLRGKTGLPALASRCALGLDIPTDS